MKGKWKVIYNPMGGYIIARLKDTSQTEHSGNMEYYGEYSDSKAELSAIADKLNKEGI